MLNVKYNESSYKSSHTRLNNEIIISNVESE